MGKLVESAKVSREKHWEELDDEGKIARLRQVIKNQETLITRMANYLSELVEHEHMDGKMVKRLSHPQQESYSGFHYRKRDDKWF